MSKREAFEAWKAWYSEAYTSFIPMHEGELDNLAQRLSFHTWCVASQAQLDSNLHWCGTCEQNVDCGCGDSACQYRYKLPPAPMNEVNKPEGDKP